MSEPIDLNELEIRLRELDTSAQPIGDYDGGRLIIACDTLITCVRKLSAHMGNIGNGVGNPEEYALGALAEVKEAQQNETGKTMKTKRFKKAKDGEWIQPLKRGYLMACCDCMLVHRMDFRIHKDRVQFRASRANYHTKRMRKLNRIELKP